LRRSVKTAVKWRYSKLMIPHGAQRTRLSPREDNDRRVMCASRVITYRDHSN